MRLLVTGSSRLMGSEVVSHVDAVGWEVHGIDNNMRADFFGPESDTRWNQCHLEATCQRFRLYELDIRDRAEVLKAVAELRPNAVVLATSVVTKDAPAGAAVDADPGRVIGAVLGVVQGQGVS